MKKIGKIILKRHVAFTGIALLTGGIMFGAKHRAGAVKNHIVPPKLAYNHLTAPFQIPDSDFADNVNLWGAPAGKIYQANLGYTGLNFQNELASANFEKFQTPLNFKNAPAFTVMNRELGVPFFEAGTFIMTFNLKPAYANPDALMPSRIDTGIGGTFSF